MKKRLLSILLVLTMVVSLIPAFTVSASAEGQEPAGRGETWDFLYSEIVAKGSFYAYEAGKKVYFDILPQTYEPSDDDSKYAYFSTYDYAVNSGLVEGIKDDNYINSCHQEEITINQIFELPETCEASFDGKGTLKSGGYWVLKIWDGGNAEFFAVKSSGNGDSISVDPETKYVTPSSIRYTNNTETLIDDIFFGLKITDETGLIDLFTNGGYGYLANNIILGNSDLSINCSSNTVNLFLNGKTIDLNEKHIKVCDSATFNLYDNGTTGIIKNGNYSDGGAFEVVGNNTVFNMYGGTIKDCTSSRGGAVHVNMHGTFHMYEGLITKNKASNNGGGVYNNSEDSFHMHGGTIADNYAENEGGGVFNSVNLSFDGKCIVDDNYVGPENNKREENVYTGELFNLFYDDQIAVGLIEGSKVGITWVAGKGQITNNYSNPSFDQAKQTDYFFADNPDYYVTYNKGTGEGGYLEIVDHKHCVCGHDDCTGEGHDTEQGWIALPSGEFKYFSGDAGPNGDANDYAPFKCTFNDNPGEERHVYYLESGYYYLTGDIKVDSPIDIKSDVVICLNGYNITRTTEKYKHSDDLPFIVVHKYSSLTITDCKQTPHYFKYSTEDAWEYYGGAAPTSGEIDTLDTIDGDTEYVKLFGGCIYGGKNSGLDTCGGDLTLISGNVVGNRCVEGSGGGVRAGGKFIMNGGNIVGNKSELEMNSVGRGGGVYVSIGKDPYHNDEVTVGEFTMNGGIIGYNIAEADEDGYGAFGGGVYVEYTNVYTDLGASGATFTMNGGSIIGNRTALCSQGSGIYANGDITISGDAKIQNNIGMYGIWIESFYPYGYSGDEYFPTFTAGGNAQVINNVLTPNGEICNCNSAYGSYITVGTGANAPGNNMKVGIYPYCDPFSKGLYNLPYTFTTNGTSDDTKGFVSDIDSVYVKANAENKKLQLVSRITEQPDVSNNYKITVDNKKPNVVPSYQWKKASYTPEELSSIAALIQEWAAFNNCGNIESNKYVAASNGNEYSTSFTYRGNIQYVTFNSTNTDIKLSESDTTYSLESDGEGNYVYKSKSGKPIKDFTVCSDKAFTLTDMKFYFMTLGDDVTGETNRQLTEGTKDEVYLCRVTYDDDSYEDSKPVTVLETFKITSTPTVIYYNPTQTFTVPVSGNESTVKIQAEIKGNTAEVKEIKESDLKTVGTEKQVVIDLSGIKDSVDAAVITKSSLKNIVDSGADGLKVIMPDGTIAEFDKTAIKAILDQALGDDIKLVIDRNEKAEQTLTTSQKTTLETMNNPAVLDAYFVSGGKRISDFNGGTATVTAEYKSEYPVRIWYLMNDGEKEAVPSEYDKEKQLATFEVNHFSHYVAEQIEEASEEINKVSEVKIRVYSKYVRVNGKRYIKPYIKVLKGQDTLDTLKDAGYTFKYVFYRSTSTKTSLFKKLYTTKNQNFTDKKGTNGKYYYYKAKLMIYDENGELVKSTTLGQCKYGCRLYNENSKNMK